MKVNVLVLLVVILLTASLFAQIGTHIPQESLPYDNFGVLEWTKAGCLKQLQEDGGLDITKFYNIEEFDQNNLSAAISDTLYTPANTNHSLLFYFPPGVYEFDETIVINRDNVVFKGAGMGETIKKNRIKNMEVLR